MSEIAKASGLTREGLYKALRADAQPRFDTISRVCAALGVRFPSPWSQIGGPNGTRTRAANVREFAQSPTPHSTCIYD
jgi:transcriptional regulator with XRE-family HTH domain